MEVRPVIAASCLTLAACSFGGNIGTGYRCAPGEPCDAGGGADADILAAGRCGTLALLQDDFAGGGLEPTWYPWDDAPDAVIAESGGDAVVSITGGSADPWAGADSSIVFDMEGGALDVEVAGTGGVSTVIEVRASDGSNTQIYAEDGMIAAAVFDSPQAGTRNEIAYDPDQHRYWRIREAGGTMYWELSGNRTDWIELHAESPPPIPLAHVRGIVAAGGQLATASTARFADVNGAAPASLAFCPTADLVDDFAAAPLDPLWDWWDDPGCTVGESGGALTVSFPAGAGDTWCGITSRHVYDLRESELVIDAAGAIGATDLMTELLATELGHPSNNLMIKRQEEMVHVHQAVNDSDVSARDLAYDADAHRFWRLRGAGGRIYFDASSDGVDWAPLHDADAAIDLSRVVVVITAGTINAGPGTPQTVTIAAVNPP